MPSSDWDQYKAAPTAGNQWDQYKQAPQSPAPTSGPIGAKVPEPAGLIGPPTPAENNKSALFTGLKGMGKSLADTAQTIHSNNTPKDPTLAPTFSASPMQSTLNMDTSTHGDSDEMAGKVFGNIAQMAVPMDAAAGVLPSAERSGAKLSELAGKLKGAPVSLTRATPALDRAEQISARGGGPMGAAGNLLDRSRAVAPMNFPEARDYYSNVSKLTSLDKQSMSNPLKAQIGKARAAFHGDLAETANQGLPATEIGYRGQPMNGGKADYENAIEEFRHAKQLQGAGKFLVKKAIPAVGGAGIVAEGARRLIK